MTDARKMAEEALARWDALPSGDVDDLAAWDVARDGMERFRALLASEPARRAAEAEALIRMAYDARFGGTAWQRRAHAYLWDAPPDAADARRRAEEALAEYDRLWGAAHATNAYGRAVVGLASALRALLAAGPEAKAPGHDRIAELESLLRECNAVCLCGCPDAEHESYGEDGESCGDEEHECVRVAPAVLAYVQALRQKWADLGEDYEGLRAQINPPHPSWDTSCARCGRDLTVSSVTCGECCAEAPAAGVVEVTPAPPPSDEVREAAERTRYATAPDRGDNRVPYCSEQCPQHDGKRCRIMGVRPSSICEPEVLNLLADLAARGGAE